MLQPRRNAEGESVGALQNSNRRSGVVPVSGSVPSVGMGWVIPTIGMAIPMVGMSFRPSE